MIRSTTTFFLSLLGSLLLWSCCPEDPFVATKTPVIPVDSAKQAFLRVVIVDPGIEPVEVRVDAEPLFSRAIGHLNYPDTVYNAEFWPVDTAGTQLSFVPSGGTPIATKAMKFPKGSYQTAYLFQENGQYQIMVTWDTPTAKPSLSEVRYRIVNLTKETPTVDIAFKDSQSGSEFKVDGLGFGDTTAILTQTSAFQKELRVTESGTGKEIVVLPSVLLPGESVVTIVMAGQLRPRGDEKFMFFNVFTDSRLNNRTDLYGSLPISLELLAVRFVNLMGFADSTLDLSFEDKIYGCDFPDCFRRNLPGQSNTVIAVAPLGTDTQFSEKGYFFLSKLLDIATAYRVEIHRLEFYDTSVPQSILIEKQPFPSQASRRYTVVAYGPFNTAEAKAATLVDRTTPPSQGMANVRFFHGAYKSLMNERLQIRISGATGPAMNYGQAPEALTEFMSVGATSSATVEVLNGSGTVVHTQSGVELKGGKTYTAFLSEGPRGNGLFLKALAEDVVPE